MPAVSAGVWPRAIALSLRWVDPLAFDEHFQEYSFEAILQGDRENPGVELNCVKKLKLN